MCDQNANTGKVVLLEGSKQCLIKAANPVIGIRRALAIGYPIEEMSVFRPVFPHLLHRLLTWLEVSKVLLPQSRLLPYFYVLS